MIKMIITISKINYGNDYNNDDDDNKNNDADNNTPTHSNNDYNC